jgi:ATP-binding protein involved in chromosome partitioning
MGQVTKDQVIDVLKRTAAPGGRGNLVSAGLVSDIVIDGGNVMFAIQADPAKMQEMEALRHAAEKAVSSIPGVAKAMVALTADRQQQQQRPQASGVRGAVPGVKHLIAIASGKGGVGKSTCAVNIALGLQAQGLKVAMLDADVYGPSLPKLLGLSGRPRVAEGDSKKLAPMEAYGLQVMSMGFLVDEGTPTIWRGPMVMSALVQMLREVAWSDIDAMVVDMPPGTGDVQLTMAQQTPLSGAVIVSTPQDLALIDARKGLNMFKRVNVPVLGIVENMSYFVCTKCGERHEIFGHGGARAEAEKLAVPFLGEVPLDADLRARSDEGRPVVATAPQSVHAAIYRDIARQIWTQVAGGTMLKQPPRIVIE